MPAVTAPAPLHATAVSLDDLPPGPASVAPWEEAVLHTAIARARFERVVPRADTLQITLVNRAAAC